MAGNPTYDADQIGPAPDELLQVAEQDAEKGGA